MGEQRQLHPRETMDDITEVSSTASIERKNTFMITKNAEARSKTVFSTIIGGVIGLLICLMLAPIIGITFGVVFILIGLVAAPFLMVGQVKDRTQQVRWKRLLRKLQSRNIAGEVFYPNSNQPEHLSSLKEMWIL